MLDGNEDGAAPLAAERESLHDPEEREQDRRADTDGGEDFKNWFGVKNESLRVFGS